MTLNPAAPPAKVLFVDGGAGSGISMAAELASALPVAPDLIWADCGRSALHLLRQEARDLVIADLPSLADLGTSTDEMVSRVVRQAAGALLVVLASGASVSATLSIMGAGAHDCMGLPFAEGALGTRVVELARRHGKGHLLCTPAEGGHGREALGDALARMQAAFQQMTRAAEQGGSRRPVLPMWRQEQRIIEDAIASCGGNIALAAAALEISPSTIYRKRQNWAENDAQGAA